ncbi:type I-F CRISPR-associated helicase Cas3f [Thioalkalivibrio sp. ALE19]|uniref:type I-F CRISPR-associated helicase Cas3f n=1 Tax=Thioalkalivibrio sp. ALE19 TaxID=1266909 RepID=UPI00041D6810|nr:type I-F CRISPR-associated helicase Cas3f [Thioalkalivibrio sp. ALE19]
MQIAVVSLCEKRAIQRTRRVMDRYAVRSGNNTWMTMISAEGAREIRKALRKTATRNTAVACYQVKRRTWSLLWVVGRSGAFGPHGAVAVSHQKRAPASFVPPWVRKASLVAGMAGVGHDVGKNTFRFQGKLEDSVKGKNSTGSVSDRIRHEWVSTRVVEEWRKAQKQGAESGSLTRLADVWPEGRHIRKAPSILDDDEGIDSADKAVDLGILTHHGLLGPSKCNGTLCEPDSSRHVRHGDTFADQTEDAFRCYREDGFGPYVERQLERFRKRLSEFEGQDPDLWKGVAIIARAAVIGADHEVSSVRYPRTSDPEGVFANTATHDGGGSRVFNQPLDFHLLGVSRDAQRWVYRFANLNLPGMTAPSREAVRERSGPGRFEWQDIACDHLSRYADHGPHLVMNCAETGSGKTRANVRIAESLQAPGDPFRLSVALNLRSLTLQTSAALSEQLRIPDDEVACLVGDSFSRQVFDEKAHEWSEDNDETEGGDIDLGRSIEPPEMPPWLESWSERDRQPSQCRTLIGTPILVSTVDYLIQAGEPGRQHHHLKAFLRLMSSDLVLDEIESYEPEAMVAVLRLVTIAAMFGRKIVASSATLSPVVANALIRAFRSGCAMRAALNEQTLCGNISLVDNLTEPETFDVSEDDAGDRYAQRIQRMMSVIEERPATHRAMIQCIPDEDDDPKSRFELAVANAIRQMHENTAWHHPSGKRVSFGVVRVANVRPCVDLTRRLNRRHGIFASSYHSFDVKGRRAAKERRMDHLFTRKGDDPLATDDSTDHWIRDSEFDDVTFLVVATPVEEIGRDHDFDFGVIEPSSISSIVQLAGRVNRHRRVTTAVPNIAILDRNLRSLRKPTETCFVRPGNGDRFSDEEKTRHSMTDLLNTGGESFSSEDFPLTSTLKFGSTSTPKTPFADLDDRAVERAMFDGMNAIQSRDGHEKDWISLAHYEKFPLRDNKTILLRFVKQDEHWSLKNVTSTILDPVKDVSVVEGSPSWLSQSLDDVRREFREYGDRAMEIECGAYVLDSMIQFDDREGGR